jgi:hypothetical protein
MTMNYNPRNLYGSDILYTRAELRSLTREA